MTEKDLNLALYKYLHKISGIEVIVAKQSEHRPEIPYIVFDYVTYPKKLGYDDTKMDGTTYVVKGLREFTISVNAYSEEAFDILSDVQSAYEYPSMREYLFKMGLVHVSSSDVQDLTELEESRFQKRAQLDLTFRMNRIDKDENTGYIDKVELTNGIDSTTSVINE